MGWQDFNWFYARDRMVVVTHAAPGHKTPETVSLKDLGTRFALPAYPNSDDFSHVLWFLFDPCTAATMDSISREREMLSDDARKHLSKMRKEKDALRREAWAIKTGGAR